MNDQPETQKSDKTRKGQIEKENRTIADRTGERGKKEDPKLHASEVRDDLDRLRRWQVWRDG